MKKILYYISSCLLITALGTSCKKTYDNYPAPAETLKGTIYDNTTKLALQTETGGVRLKLDELSWSDNPTPFYFTSKQDGTYQNTKLFAGHYRVTPDGPFVPFTQGDTIDIKGVTTLDFHVDPFLAVKWNEDPTVTGTSISVNVTFNRGTADPAFQNAISDIFLFVNAVPYVGNNSYDNRYSTQLKYKGGDDNAPIDGNTQVGIPITLTTTGTLAAGRTYYVRVGVRTTFGQKQYNYTDVKTVTIPQP